MTVERWLPVATHESYEVSDRGRVRRNGAILRRQRGRDGYWRVQMWRLGLWKNSLVHVLIAEAFIGPRPPGREVNHRDGDKSNAAVENLEYVTRSENNRHAYRTGLRQVTVQQMVDARRQPRRSIACACGCGGQVETPDSKGRERRFAHGHNRRRAVA